MKNPTSEEQGNKHSHVPSDIALRVKALESVLTEKKLIDPSALDEVVDRYKNKVGPSKRCQGCSESLGRFGL